MRIFSHPIRRPQAGYGLIIVMLSLGIMLILFASVLFWSSSNAKITIRNNLFNESENAAESSTENILAYMMRDFTYGNLGSASSYATNFPPTNGWPIYYQFSCTNGDPNANTNYAASVWIGSVSTSATNLDSQFAGLYGFVMPCVISSTATPQGQGQNLSATVTQTIQFALIPLFQYAIFYNMDLEINPGDAMTINGRVHSNNSIWTTGDSPSLLLTYSTNVEAVTGVFLNRSTNDPSATRSGNVVFTDSNSNPDQRANPMTLPIGTTTTNNNPTNVLAVINPPPTAYAPLVNYSAAYFGPGSNYLENAADLIITNPPSGLATTHGANIIIYYQNPNNTPYFSQVLPDVIGASNVVLGVTNVVYSYYSFVTNVSFYDYREGDTVQAVQINVAAFNTWLTNYIVLGTNHSGINYSFPIAGSTIYSNTAVVLGGQQYNALNTSGSTSKAHQINSIYVYNSVPLTSSQLPAVRMVNGRQLPPSGLTVVTPQPMYVKGDYNITTDGTHLSQALGNTTYTYPAGLFADAVTILSSNWSDAYTSLTGLSSRTPASIAINAATLEGIVPSSTNSPSHYSGGVENFLRLLESWSSSTTLTYNGSIVVMFPSQYATNFYAGSYYGVPKRAWGFDLNFNQSSKLPPLTPQVKQTVRGTWSAN